MCNSGVYFPMFQKDAESSCLKQKVSLQDSPAVRWRI